VSQSPTTRLRVAMLGSFPPQTQGIQNYCGDIAAALAAYCGVTAIGFAKMYPASLFPGVKQAIDETRPSIERDGLRVRNVLTWYNPLGWLWNALRAPADVVHVQWWSLPLFPVCFTFALAAKFRRKRIVVTVHNVLPHERSRFFLPASRTLCRMADAVIVHGAISAAHAQEYLGLPAENVHTVAMGMSSVFVEPRPMDAARRELGLRDEDRVILFFGIIRDYKGLDILIEAAAKLMAEDDRVRLIVAGKPWAGWEPYAEQIERLGIGDRVIAFPDYVPENRVPVLFSAADVVALPYRHFNAQSAVAATSLPYRKPTIVSRTGDLPESVDGRAEWIVEPDNVEDLAEKLRQFFANQAERTREFEQIAQKVCRDMSWDSVAERHVRIYNKST
jgi:glycosyltransferase involved in cell wall biosynthesis